MVPRALLRWAGDRVGRALLMAYLVVMAMSTGLLYGVFRETRMILHVLNGGCLP